jgi:hypothetical protein
MPSRGTSQSTKTRRGRKTGTTSSGASEAEPRGKNPQKSSKKSAMERKTLPKRSRASGTVAARAGEPVAGHESGSNRKRGTTNLTSRTVPKKTTRPKKTVPARGAPQSERRATVSRRKTS